MSSVINDSESNVIGVPHVVISPGSVDVIDAVGGGGGGGGAAPHIVISPAFAESDITLSNTNVAQKVRTRFIVFS